MSELFMNSTSWLRSPHNIGAFALILVTAACSNSTASDDAIDSGTDGIAMGDDEVSDPDVATGPLDNGAVVPFTPGDVVDVEPMEWTYVHTPGAICRDGNETGMGININPDSDKLIIYLEGGGACFNPITCLANPASWGEADLGSPAGVLRRSEDNPFGDWNMVYIPYCSGDVFTGTMTDGTGYQGDTMQGYINVGEYLKRIVPTFDSASEVVLTGMSAGGFGASFNWLRTQDAFGDTPVHLLDDSGPPMSSKYLPHCWQSRIGVTWGWADAVHPACEQCDVEAGEVIVPLIATTLDRLGNDGAQRFALLSNDEDGTIKTFAAYGVNECENYDALFPTYPVGLYPEGLAALEDRLGDNPSFGLFQVTGGGHTFLAGNYEAIEVNGTTLQSFLEAFRDGTDDFDSVIQQ